VLIVAVELSPRRCSVGQDKWRRIVAQEVMTHVVQNSPEVKERKPSHHHYHCISIAHYGDRSHSSHEDDCHLYPGSRGCEVANNGGRNVPRVARLPITEWSEWLQLSRLQWMPHQVVCPRSKWQLYKILLYKYELGRNETVSTK
jgi:hypothetical protein